MYFLSYEARFKNAKKAGPKTCQWILKHESFQSWLGANDSTILLVSGKPGCGKSVLARYVTEELPGILRQRQIFENGGPFRIAYFFFNDRGERVEKTTAGMLRALLYQILHDNPFLFSSIRIMDEFEKLKGKSPGFEWPLHVLKDLFLSLKNHKVVATFYLIIDSLDESEAEHSASEVLQVLQELCSGTMMCNFKVFLTSRPETFLAKLDETFNNYPRIRLESTDIKYTSSDIQAYVSSQTIKLLRHRQEELGPLREIIIHRAEGVFLWVDLVMKKLVERTQKGDTLHELENIVENLPSEMEALYRKILRNIESEDAEERKVMLQWVLFAERPLTLSEFQIAIKFTCSSYTSEVALLEDMQNPGDLKRRISSRSGGLLEFKSVVRPLHEDDDMSESEDGDISGSEDEDISESEDGDISGSEDEDISDSEDRGTVVQLIHQSAKDFLLSNGNEWFSVPSIESGNWSLCHSQLAQSCLKYLSFYEFEGGPTYPYNRRSPQYEETLRKHQLLLYAAVYWPSHACKAPQPSPNLWSAFCEMKWDPLRANFAFQILQLEYYRRIPSQTITPLHIVSEFGLNYFVSQILLQGGVDINAMDDHGWTALHRAAGSGHEAVVRLLLEKSAELGSKETKYGWTPLSSAAGETVVLLLLENGAELESKDNSGQTPLSWAAVNEQVAVVQLLIKKGAELESKDNNGQTPLSWAASLGQEAVVQLLLEKGAELESKDNNGQTPLSWAARDGRKAVVQLLLEEGAELESKDNDGQTPLSWVASLGREALVQLLLEKGAELESKDNNGQTPLSLAASLGREAVVQLLLEKGAELESKDTKYGRTPLLWAAETGTRQWCCCCPRRSPRNYNNP